MKRRARNALRGTDNVFRMTSLDELESTDHIKALQYDQPMMVEDHSFELHERVAKLPARLRYVVTRLLSGVQLTQIGNELGISEPRVSQLKTKAIGFLRGERRFKRPDLMKEAPTPLPPPNPFEALIDGTHRIKAFVNTEEHFGVEIVPANRKRLTKRTAEVLKHWLACGIQKQTAFEFSLSRSRVAGIVDDACKAIGFSGMTMNLPLIVFVLARADHEQLPLQSLNFKRSSCNLTRLSPAELRVVVPMLDGATRAEILRGKSYSTIANQLASAYKRFEVSTLSELRAKLAVSVVYSIRS